MGLEITEIQKRLKEPRNKTKIPGLKQHENRLRLHTEPTLSMHEAAGTANQILNWVETLLPRPKYLMFKRFFRTPLDTVQVVNEAYQAIEKIFEGKDAVFAINFEDKELESDYAKFRQGKLRIDQVMRTKAFECFKTAINSFVLVDLPTEQTTDYPEPYLSFIDVSAAIDWQSNDTGLDWFLFNHSTDHVGFCDDTRYCLFKVKDDKIIETVVDHEHGLMECPANWAFNIPLSYRDIDKKAALITPCLGDLDYLLYFMLSKKYSDQYAAWQIYWGYSSECDFEQDVKDITYSCDGGFMRADNGEYVFTGDTIMPCPKCKTNITGVGSFIEVPAPDADTPNMAPPVGMVPTDVPGLNYVVEEIERRKSNFFKAVTGNALEATNNQAMNKEQILSLFESRMQTIMKWKKPFEDLQTWVERIVCKLRYAEQFIGLQHNYGTEFYLYGADTILGMYQDAIKNGADHLVLDILQDNYIESKYKHNNAELTRAKTLLALDPFRHLKIDQVKDMYRSGHVDFKDYYLKANFSTMVMRFERMNGPIGEHLKEQPMLERVETIRAIINTFIQEPNEPGEAQTTEDGSL